MPSKTSTPTTAVYKVSVHEKAICPVCGFECTGIWIDSDLVPVDTCVHFVDFRRVADKPVAIFINRPKSETQ